MSMEIVVKNCKTWLKEAREIILDGLNEPHVVHEKTERQDIVTEMDTRVQDFLVGKINEHYPNDKILAEENGKNSLPDRSGRVWVIDPIDGTLNFFYQKKNFAIMIGIYEDGIGKVGFIYDVAKDLLYWGGQSFGGVYRNESPLPSPTKCSMRDGLIAMNSYMYAENSMKSREIGNQTMGIRSNGSAAMEFINLLEGDVVAYICNLSPWDWAAGAVLTAYFGFVTRTIGKEDLNWDARDYLAVCYPEDYEEFYM